MRPLPSLAHLSALTDDVGILQHATYAVPAREHGYCLDDNARGLMLAAGLRQAGADAALPVLFGRTAAFVQHAWNPEAGRFRNFMGYDRRWLDEVGTEDSHGRAIFALGVVARDVADADAHDWAHELLDRALPALDRFTSPRALACGLLGIAAAEASPKSPDLAVLRDRLAGRLGDHLRDNERPDWVWFENYLTYDNARLPQAMLAAGRSARRQDWIEAGLRTLAWLCRVQTNESGGFSPIGSDGFWHRGSPRARFDQQPVEAAGAVAAAAEALRITGDPAWRREAARAHAWFTGANDLGLTLVDPRTGGCRDGLHPARVNANQGAESTLAWLQAVVDMAALQPDAVKAAVE